MSHLSKKIIHLALIAMMLLSSQSTFAKTEKQESTHEKPTAAGKFPEFGLTQQAATLEQGKKVYTTYCVGCHGINGDGNGPASKFLNPKPRNFQTAQFRFSSRTSGDLPTDEDLYRSINEGLKGTSMTGWPLLAEVDKRAVIQYLKTFARETWANANPSLPTAISDDPYYGSDKKEAIKRGEIVYHGMAQCYSCHPGYIAPDKINDARAVFQMGIMEGFRADLGHSRLIQNEDGTSILPPDFTWDHVKRGSDPRTLYHVIGNGIGGVAMPTWKGVFTEEDLWALVYYVQDLTNQRPRLVTDKILKERKEKLAKYEADVVTYNNKTAQAAK